MGHITVLDADVDLDEGPPGHRRATETRTLLEVRNDTDETFPLLCMISFYY